MKFLITSFIFLSVFSFSTARASELGGIRVGSVSLTQDAKMSNIVGAKMSSVDDIKMSSIDDIKMSSINDIKMSNINVTMSPLSTQSCFARAAYSQYPPPYPSRPDDVPGHYYQINNFVIFWSDHKADLYVSYIMLDIRHPYIENGFQRTIITGAELASMDGSRGYWDRWIQHREWPWRQPAEFHALCGPISGNIHVTPETADFIADGYVTVVGVRRDYHGYESSVSFGAPLSVYHQAGF